MNLNFIKWETEGIKSTITAVLIAISLFFTGIIYGDAPVEMKITYDIPSQIYEYEAGDEVEIKIIEENVGRSFKAKIEADYGFEDIQLYSSETNSFIYGKPSDSGITLPGFRDQYVKKGDKRETVIKVTIPEWADKGEYNLKVRLRFLPYDCELDNDIVVFENVITVK